MTAQDNMELACAFIQKTAIEKAIPEIDKHLITVSFFFHFIDFLFNFLVSASLRLPPGFCKPKYVPRESAV